MARLAGSQPAAQPPTPNSIGRDPSEGRHPGPACSTASSLHQLRLRGESIEFNSPSCADGLLDGSMKTCAHARAPAKPQVCERAERKEELQLRPGGELCDRN